MSAPTFQDGVPVFDGGAPAFGLGCCCDPCRCHTALNLGWYKNGVGDCTHQDCLPDDYLLWGGNYTEDSASCTWTWGTTPYTVSITYTKATKAWTGTGSLGPLTVAGFVCSKVGDTWTLSGSGTFGPCHGACFYSVELFF